MSSRPARIPVVRRFSRIAVPALAAALLAMGAGGAGAQTLGQPDPPPPPPAATIAIPEPAPDPAPVPAEPAPAAPAPAPTPAPAPAPAPTPAPSAPAPAPPAPAAGEGAAAAAAAALERRRATEARRLREARARKAAVMRIGGDVGTGVADASVTLSRIGGTTKSAAELRPAAASPAAAAPGSGRESMLAFLLLGLSGATAAVALLPLRSVRTGGGRSAVTFVARHRLEIAGISTSCLLVALLVFVGLI